MLQILITFNGSRHLDDIVDLLNLRRWQDFARTSGGWIAKRRIDIAPLAYEIKVNAPPSNAGLRELVQFARPASPDFVSQLYMLCNGLRVGATKFAVYGLRGDLPRDDPEASLHIVLDTNQINVWGRPQPCTEDLFFVGASSEGPPRNRREHYHYIGTSERIGVVQEGNLGTDVRSYDSVHDWLRAEVERALADIDNY